MNPFVDWMMDGEAAVEHQGRLRESEASRDALSAAMGPARGGSSWWRRFFGNAARSTTPQSLRSHACAFTRHRCTYGTRAG